MIKRIMISHTNLEVKQELDTHRNTLALICPSIKLLSLYFIPIE